MGLHRFSHLCQEEWGILRTLAPIRDSAIIEYGCMGHDVWKDVSK